MKCGRCGAVHASSQDQLDCERGGALVWQIVPERPRKRHRKWSWSKPKKQRRRREFVRAPDGTILGIVPKKTKEAL